MKKFYVFFCFFVVFFLTITDSLLSQPAIEWQKTYGGSEDELDPLVIKTSDNGFLIAGSSMSDDYDITGNHGYFDIWVVKTDSSGDIVWEKSFGGSEGEFLNGMTQTQDGKYLLTGFAQSSDGDISENKGLSDLWILKIDSSGSLEWQKTYGGSNNDEGVNIIEMSDGNILIAGKTLSSDSDITSNQGLSDIWILKLNAGGDKIWQKTYGGSQNDYASAVIETGNKGFIVAGSSDSDDGDMTDHHYYSTEKSDYIVFEADSSGDILWMKNYGGNENEFLYGMNRTMDSCYIIYGISNSDNGDINNCHGALDGWIVKINLLGGIQWQKSIGGSQDDYVFSLVQGSDEFFILQGSSKSSDGQVTTNYGNSDCWILKLNPSGPLVWQKSFGGTGIDIGYSVLLLNDDNCVVSAATNSADVNVTSNHGYMDYWLVNLSNISALEDYSFSSSDIFNIYPNPVSEGEVYFAFNKEIKNNATITFIDINGRILKEIKINDKDLMSFNVDWLPKGMFFVRLTDDDNTYIRKLIIQ